MRKLVPIILTALAAACTTPERKQYAADPEADARFEKGLALFASAETAPVPSEAYLEAGKEFEAAATRVPSPEHRFAHARVRLLLDPEDAAAKEAVASIVAEAPEDARFRALAALVQASLDDAEKAADLAAVGSLTKAERCFVGDTLMLVIRAVAPRTRDDADRRARLTLRAADLGSADALVFSARLHWLGKKPPLLDWPKAREQARAAAETRFPPAEAARALLVGTEVRARMGARELGHMLVEDGDFAAARPWLEKGLAVPEDLVDRQAVIALAELGSIEAFALDGDEKNKARGLENLRVAGDLGCTPALVRRAWLDKDARAELLETAMKRGSPGAYAAAGDFDKLLQLLETQRDSARTPLDQLPWQRLVFFVRALQKGGAVRTEIEKLAREAVENAPDNTSVPVARQFRHIAGELSAAELQATMRKTDHVPAWRAETEMALATRCLILGDQDGAKKHLALLLEAGALFTPEDEVAWGALRKLSR